MKKIFMLLVAFAAMWCVSCSDDDDNNGTPLGGKQVSKMIYIQDDEFTTYTYEYDSEGRVTKETYVSSNNDEESGYSSYTYGKNSITVTNKYTYGTSNHTDETLYLLNDKGFIISETSDYNTATYHYDNSDHLLSIKSKEGDDDYSFTWEDENITKQIYTYETRNYTYNSHSLKNFGVNYLIEDTPNNILFIYGYFGAKNKNLIASEEDGSDQYTYEYKFDKEGYVTEMREYIIENGTKTLETTVTVEYK